MQQELSLQQVFLRRRGGQLEALIVLENLAGATYRETLPLATADRAEGVRKLARQLASRGTVSEVARLRLRVEAQGALQDDAALKQLLLREFRYCRERS